ncbi:MAG: YfjI family protein, partial [Actinomycetota bacterium]|nr:YfjI family protein [Actinomycetota bacterium]
VPVDLPAMLGLGALSIATAGRLAVHVRSTWKEPMALYLATALPPSSGKSPAFRAMLGPIDEWEAALIDSAAGRISELDQERRILEKKMKRLEDSDRADEARAARVELEALDTAVLPQVVADDVTPEKLVQILAEQDGRLAIASPEGGIFDMMAGKYSDSSTLDPYLKAWSGDTIKVDRMTRAGAVVRRPVLSIAITVQPSVIEALAANKELRGRGLTARFMYSVPEDLVGRRNLLDAPMADPDAAERYGRRLVAIMRRWWEHPELRTIPLGPEAAGLFMAWRQELEDQRGPNGPLRHMAEWTTKLESSVARLAGLLAVAGFDTAGPPLPSATVGADEMAAAIVIGDYWLNHGKVVHDMWSADPVAGLARRVMQWAADQPVDNFTVRGVFNALRRTAGSVDNLARPLAMLVDHGWIRLAEGHDGSTGRGKPSPAYDVHPEAVVTFASCSSHVRNSSAYHAYSALKGDDESNTPLLAETEREGPPYALYALYALPENECSPEIPAEALDDTATSAPKLSTGESYPQADGDYPPEWGEL